MKYLTAIPVYNEERHVAKVIREVRRYSPDILVVNDGSNDGTGRILAQEPHLAVVTHPSNRGYGAALISAFDYAVGHGYDVLVTMDCDGQHEPARIPVLLEAIHDADIVSGSRYLRDFRQTALPTPADRRFINQTITAELNDRFGLNLTDAFCGFKAYRVSRSGPTAHHGNWLGHAVCSFGCRLRRRACGSRKSACRAFTSIRRGLSAACSMTPSSAWPIIVRSSPMPLVKTADELSARFRVLRGLSVRPGAVGERP